MEDIEFTLVTTAILLCASFAMILAAGIHCAYGIYKEYKEKKLQEKQLKN